MHTDSPASISDLPKLQDPPFLIAILIGAMKSGDAMIVSLARAWLAEAGIRIHFAKDAPALQQKGRCAPDLSHVRRTNPPPRPDE